MNKISRSHNLQRLLFVSYKPKSVTSALSIETLFYHMVAFYHCLRCTRLVLCVLYVFLPMRKLHLSTFIKQVCCTVLSVLTLIFLCCFDTVGWVTGRTSGAKFTKIPRNVPKYFLGLYLSSS